MPHVLGFHPADSLVLLGFGQRSMGARIDLPRSAEECAEGVGAMCRAAAAAPPSEAFVVVYSEHESAGEAAGVASSMVSTLLGVPCHGAVVTSRGVAEVRGDGALGPVVAVDHVAHRFSAEAAFRGRPSPLGGREALNERVQAAGPAVEGVAEAASRLAALGAGGLPGEARWMLATLRRAVSGGPGLSEAEAARVMAGVGLVPLRDVVWSAITREKAEEWADLLCVLVGRAPECAVPPLATLLAIAAWLKGDGALSWCALDRSAEVDPSYSLASLVASMLQAGLPPWIGQEAMPSTDDALAALGRS